MRRLPTSTDRAESTVRTRVWPSRTALPTISSVEPPPQSTTSSPSPSHRAVAPMNASSASRAPSITVVATSRSASIATNSRPLSASRLALVASAVIAIDVESAHHFSVRFDHQRDSPHRIGTETTGGGKSLAKVRDVGRPRDLLLDAIGPHVGDEQPRRHRSDVDGRDAPNVTHPSSPSLARAASAAHLSSGHVQPIFPSTLSPIGSATPASASAACACRHFTPRGSRCPAMPTSAHASVPPLSTARLDRTSASVARSAAARDGSCAARRDHADVSPADSSSPRRSVSQGHVSQARVGNREPSSRTAGDTIALG